jgi:hypothetical protein
MCLSFWRNDRRSTVLSLAGPYARLLPKKDAPGRLCGDSLIIMWGRREFPAGLERRCSIRLNRTFCAASTIHPVPENLYQVEPNTILAIERFLFQVMFEKKETPTHLFYIYEKIFIRGVSI